jgi:hypothetical protein
VTAGDTEKAKSAGDPDESHTKDNRSQATLLVELARDEYRLGVSPDGLAFAVPFAGPNVALPLAQTRGGVKSALAHRFHELYGRVPASNGVNDAIRVLHHECEMATPEPVALRVSGGPGASSVLDLGSASGEAIVIEPDGWRLVRHSPALFRRTALTLPLPTPIHGGSLEALRALINCSDEDWGLLRAVLVAALIPEISHPVVAFTGEQGTGKTTAMSLVGKVIDPGRGGNRAAPTKEDDWAVAASASYVVGSTTSLPSEGGSRMPCAGR